MKPPSYTIHKVMRWCSNKNLWMRNPCLMILYWVFWKGWKRLPWAVSTKMSSMNQSMRSMNSNCWILLAKRRSNWLRSIWWKPEVYFLLKSMPCIEQLSLNLNTSEITCCSWRNWWPCMTTTLSKLWPTSWTNIRITSKKGLSKSDSKLKGKKLQW